MPGDKITSLAELREAFGASMGVTGDEDVLSRLRGSVPPHYLRVLEEHPMDDSNFWMWREVARMAEVIPPHYLPLPEEFGEYVEQQGGVDALLFVHRSSNNPALVAFTLNPAHGAQDRQTIMKPGKFLNTYAPQWSSACVREALGLWRASTGAYELLIAKTSDEIERVYLGGPDSCMSRPASDYDSPFHPVRVYGAGDVGVAYTINPAGAICARAVVNLDASLYGRVYGDEAVLKDLLQCAGYTYSAEALEGCTLLRHAEDGVFVCPYLDGGAYVEDDGDRLVITSSSGYRAGATNGWVGDCSCCEESFPSRHLHDVLGGSVCEACLEREYVHAYDDCGAMVSVRTDAQDLYYHDGDAYLGTGALEYAGLMLDSDGDVCVAATCEDCDYQVPDSETTSVYHDREVCSSCFDSYVTVEDASEYVHPDDAIEGPDGEYYLYEKTVVGLGYVMVAPGKCARSDEVEVNVEEAA